MAKGTVSRFVQDRGFGFIKTEDGSKEVFFHHSAYDGEPKEGQAVQFDVEDSDRGPRAANVRPI